MTSHYNNILINRSWSSTKLEDSDSDESNMELSSSSIKVRRLGDRELSDSNEDKEPLLVRQGSNDNKKDDDNNGENQQQQHHDIPYSTSGGLSTTGFYVLLLLAFQNCSKNLLLRHVMKDHPKFLTSAAILGVEGMKLILSLMYIVFIEQRSVFSAVTFMKQDQRNTFLMVVPATLYSIQMSLEYIALGNIDAAVFSVLVQTKLLATAGCSVLIMGKRIKKVQLISLVLLMIGVMLCNMKDNTESSESSKKGIFATLGIAACSGFAAVYTEKVIKAKRPCNDQLPSSHDNPSKEKYGLAYTQVQLAIVSLVIMGLYCSVMEMNQILEKGLWYGFNGPAFLSIFVSALGGLIVAAVLKFADAVLKGYATAISVILTGVLSMVLFGTNLSVLYLLGIGNVICSVILYSANDLDRLLC